MTTTSSLIGSRPGCDTLAGCVRTLESDIDSADPREPIPNKLYGWVMFLAGLADWIEAQAKPRRLRADDLLVDHLGDDIILSLAGQSYTLSDALAGVLADALDDAIIARTESADA